MRTSRRAVGVALIWWLGAVASPDGALADQNDNATLLSKTPMHEQALTLLGGPARPVLLQETVFEPDQNFLQLNDPRVFFVAPNGSASGSRGFDPIARSLQLCRQRLADCQRYEINTTLGGDVRLSPTRRTSRREPSTEMW